MKQRKVGQFDVSAIGLGCMSLSHAYGVPPSKEDAAKLLLTSLDLGYTFLDTAALYGFGANETLVGETLKGRRSDYVLASKCGIFRNAEGKREIDGRPSMIKQTCEDSLRRLQTDVIDLYYLHRWDKTVPIEDSVGAMAELVAAGKIRSIGLSEVSADTLRKAHAAHPIAAVQTEYSLWTRDPEIAVLDACRELDAAFVAFSPVGRGFLAGGVQGPDDLVAGDLRRNMPRFQSEHYAQNRAVLDRLSAIADEAGCTLAQICLAWLLQRDPIIVPIPGTTNLDHLAENVGGDGVVLSPQVMAKLDALAGSVSGHRYPPAARAEIDTEELAA